MIDINLNLPIDTTPINGSTNLIDSNAVFDGLATKENTLPSIVGNALKVLRVNAGETGKEWATISSGLTIGTTPITSGVAGRVLFEGAGNVVQEDSGLFWDNTNKSLLIRRTTVGNVLDVFAENTGNVLTINNFGSTFRNIGSNTSLIANDFSVALGQVGIRGRRASHLFNINKSTGNDSFGIYDGVTSVADFLVKNNGNILINTTTDNGGKLQVKASGALSTDIALRVRNSADTSNLFMVKGNGVLNAANLPTSPTGLVTGDIWNNLGILTIV